VRIYVRDYDRQAFQAEGGPVESECVISRPEPQDNCPGTIAQPTSSNRASNVVSQEDAVVTAEPISSNDAPGIVSQQNVFRSKTPSSIPPAATPAENAVAASNKLKKKSVKKGDAVSGGPTRIESCSQDAGPVFRRWELNGEYQPTSGHPGANSNQDQGPSRQSLP
jgi:hypothetical protein